MKTSKKYCIVIVMISMLLCMLSMTALAEDANVTYSGNSGDFVFQPGSEYSPTDLFTEFKDVMPGASISQTITVRNNADSQVKVKIYLKSLGADEGYADFLNQLKLTVTKADDTPLFDAAAGEIDGLADWTELGILYSGGETNLKLTLAVPTSLDNTYQKQMGKLTWQFMAIELPADEAKWVCPKCHESHYRIVDHDDYSEYVCESCGYKEIMKCSVCGANMHKVIYKRGDGKVWYYYECVNSKNHHTDPKPWTGDSANILLWVVIAGVCVAGLIVILILLKRRKKRNEE